MSSSKTLLSSSSSSSLIHSKSVSKHFLKSDMKLSRNSSLESKKMQKTRPCISPLPDSKSFIKAKPSQHKLKQSSSSSQLKSSEKISEKLYPSCLKDYAFLDEITSKFTLKSIELMKKEFHSYEGLYSHFLAVLSEIDSVFDKNQQLQFSMSRAREVFHLYMAKPGLVLNTLKNLPKLTETVRVSKKVISQCGLIVKQYEKNKPNGITSDVAKALRLIVNIQSKVFKAKVFIPNYQKITVKTQENYVTEEKTQEVSIMEFSQVNESGYRSVSPFFENDENVDPRTEKSDDKKSSKAKILEQLFLRIKSMPGAETSEGEGQKNNQELKNDCKPAMCLQEIQPCKVKAENIEKKAEKSEKKNKSVIIAKQKRAASNSPVPNYMQSLKRQVSSGFNQKKLQNVSKLKLQLNEKKKEWEELRLVRKT